jgi:hypothetical protein
VAASAYCGPTSLTPRAWAKQLEAVREGARAVVVCTPQLLLNRLQAGDAVLSGCVDLLVRP